MYSQADGCPLKGWATRICRRKPMKSYVNLLKRGSESFRFRGEGAEMALNETTAAIEALFLMFSM